MGDGWINRAMDGVMDGQTLISRCDEFLDASSHLNMRSVLLSIRTSFCWSVHVSIHWSIHRSIPLVHPWPGFFSSTRKRVFSTLADGWRLEWGGRGVVRGREVVGGGEGGDKRGGTHLTFGMTNPILCFELVYSIFLFVINSFLSATSQLIKSEIGFICLSLQPSSRRFIMPCDLLMKKKKIPCKWPCFNFINCSLNNETTIWILLFLWKRNLWQLAAEAFLVC